MPTTCQSCGGKTALGDPLCSDCMNGGNLGPLMTAEDAPRCGTCKHVKAGLFGRCFVAGKWIKSDGYCDLYDRREAAR